MAGKITLEDSEYYMCEVTYSRHGMEHKLVVGPYTTVKSAKGAATAKVHYGSEVSRRYFTAEVKWKEIDIA